MSKPMLAIIVLCGGAVSLSSATQVVAADFRVETEIYVEKEAQPASENLTLFQAGVVYDFALTAPEEVTIYDVGRGQIVLLDPSRRVRTTITNEQLLQFVAELKTRAEKGKAQLKFLADPKLTPTFDEATNSLTLASDVLTYTAKGAAAKDASAVMRYREFADWSARLNSTQPGRLPPFARMELNRTLAEKNLIPSEVELKLEPESRLGIARMLRSKQTFTWRLLESDQQRIARAGAQSTEFELVTLAKFRQVERVAEKK